MVYISETLISKVYNKSWHWCRLLDFRLQLRWCIRRYALHIEAKREQFRQRKGSTRWKTTWSRAVRKVPMRVRAGVDTPNDTLLPKSESATARMTVISHGKIPDDKKKTQTKKNPRSVYIFSRCIVNTRNWTPAIIVQSAIAVHSPIVVHNNNLQYKRGRWLRKQNLEEKEAKYDTDSVVYCRYDRDCSSGGFIMRDFRK